MLGCESTGDALGISLRFLADLLAFSVGMAEIDNIGFRRGEEGKEERAAFLKAFNRTVQVIRVGGEDHGGGKFQGPCRRPNKGRPDKVPQRITLDDRVKGLIHTEKVSQPEILRRRQRWPVCEWLAAVDTTSTSPEV